MNTNQLTLEFLRKFTDHAVTLHTAIKPAKTRGKIWKKNWENASVHSLWGIYDFLVMICPNAAELIFPLLSFRDTWERKTFEAWQEGKGEEFNKRIEMTAQKIYAQLQNF